MDYPWYTIADSLHGLEQGEIIIDFPFYRPTGETSENGEPVFAQSNHNAIILSQSCDLAQRNVIYVLVSPLISLDEFFGGLAITPNRKDKESLKKKLKQDTLVGYHLINSGDHPLLSDPLVVNFRNVFSVHVDNLENHMRSSSVRIRLNPPYREHLAQSFAKFIMRVGLPHSIII